MRHALLILLLLCLPAVVFAAGPAAAGDHGHEVYFGFIPGWVLKLLNMALFIGLLVFLVGGPVKKAFAARSQAIRAEAEEAKSRRAKADQMAGDIQNRLTQIEQEIVAIRQRAEAEGERQRRELVTAAEAEAAKILQSARNEVDNRLKHAREELTQYAGQLASERAEQILRERMTDGDRTKLFNDSLKEIEVARS